jgi:hypothetical protein
MPVGESAALGFGDLLTEGGGHLLAHVGEHLLEKTYLQYTLTGQSKFVARGLSAPYKPWVATIRYGYGR